VFQAPEERNWDYDGLLQAVRADIPAPVETMPNQYFVALCPLCGSRWNYLPTELFQGRPSYELIRKRSILINSGASPVRLTVLPKQPLH
jgi:hypothetical protein